MGTALGLTLWPALPTPSGMSEHSEICRSVPEELRGCEAEAEPSEGKSMGLENGQ